MPQNIAVEIASDVAVEYLNSTGEKLHGLFFNELMIDDRLAKKHHESTPYKEFAISALRPLKDNYWFRISTLDDELGVALLRRIIKLIDSKQPLTLGNNKIIFKKILQSAHNPLRNTAAVALDVIFHSAAPVSEIGIKFLTPTVFHHSKISYPLPDPYNIFKHYLRHWTNISKAELSDSDIKRLLEIMKTRIAINKLNIKSRWVKFSTGNQIGFIGKVTFRLIDVEPGDAIIMNALARLSLYCGTGYKSTMGMGQTLLLNSADNGLKDG